MPTFSWTAVRRRVLVLLPMLFSAYPLLSQSSTITISGVVTDAESGDALPGVTVMLYAADDDSLSKVVRGAVTNTYGFFSLPKVETKPWRMVVRSIGYHDHVQDISPGSDRERFDVALAEMMEGEETVTVTAEREVGPSTRKISTITLNTDYLQRLPMLGGESDILRTLQLMPGVQQATEISSGLYVRGGSPDQNLTLLDEVVIYNPSHLGGFLSTFNSDAIKDVRLIKGAFPSQYGGRLASVLDLTMREGTKKGIAGSGGISLISSRLTVEGPISDRSTFMLSGRRFYADLVKNLIAGGDSDIPDYVFYDLNGKVNYEISESDKLYLSVYHGRDLLDYTDNSDEVNIGWGNTTGNLRWAHIFSPSLFTNFSLSYSGYDFGAEIGERQGGFDEEDGFWSRFLAESGINDVRVRGEGQYFPDEDHIVRFGIEGVRHSFTRRQIDTTLSASTTVSALSSAIGTKTDEALEGALYAQDEWQATDRLALNLGGRLTWFDNGSYFYGEPRLSGTYALTGNVQLTGAVALAHQPLHLVSRNDIALPTDTWFSATDEIRPGKSWQGSLGLQGDFSGGEYGYSVEAYYKDMTHLYEYSDTAGFTLFVEPESQLTEGTGKAYGIEFFLEKKIGRLTGWLGYTFARTERTFPELNNGKTFSPRYDRRHDASIVLTYRLSDSWEMGATWVYGTGQAFTVPTGKFYQSPVDADYDYGNGFDYYGTSYRYTTRNAFRLPSYHRMDVNFSHNFSWFSLPFRLSLNVYNLYNRKNVFFWSIDEYDPETGEQKPTIRQYSLFPILPTFGLSFTF